MAHLGYDIWFVYHKILRTGSHWKSWCVHIVSVSLVATCTVYCLKFTDYCLLATVYCLADPGKPRGCFTNSLVINRLIKSVSEPFPPTALRRRHAQTVRDSSSSYIIDYIIVIKNFLNPKGHQNRTNGSKVTAILLKGWILPIGGASAVEGLRSKGLPRLVFFSG